MNAPNAVALSSRLRVLAGTAGDRDHRVRIVGQRMEDVAPERTRAIETESHFSRRHSQARRAVASGFALRAPPRGRSRLRPALGGCAAWRARRARRPGNTTVR